MVCYGVLTSHHVQRRNNAIAKTGNNTSMTVAIPQSISPRFPAGAPATRPTSPASPVSASYPTKANNLTVLTDAIDPLLRFLTRAL
jgi:hypothetical protein